MASTEHCEVDVPELHVRVLRIPTEIPRKYTRRCPSSFRLLILLVKQESTFFLFLNPFNTFCPFSYVANLVNIDSFRDRVGQMFSCHVRDRRGLDNNVTTEVEVCGLSTDIVDKAFDFVMGWLVTAVGPEHGKKLCRTSRWESPLLPKKTANNTEAITSMNKGEALASGADVSTDCGQPEIGPFKILDEEESRESRASTSRLSPHGSIEINSVQSLRDSASRSSPQTKRNAPVSALRDIEKSPNKNRKKSTKRVRIVSLKELVEKIGKEQAFGECSELAYENLLNAAMESFAVSL